ncbi:MAG: hypothetical protein IJR60_03685 [Eubacterium sp.]|nr:hypothetical protein [Eubacterium sp.]
MKINTTKNIMKGIGATLAVCSAITMMASSNKMNAASSTKHTIKKTANKITNVIDAVASFM